MNEIVDRKKKRCRRSERTKHASNSVDGRKSHRARRRETKASRINPSQGNFTVESSKTSTPSSSKTEPDSIKLLKRSRREARDTSNSLVDHITPNQHRLAARDRSESRHGKRRKTRDKAQRPSTNHHQLGEGDTISTGPISVRGDHSQHEGRDDAPVPNKVSDVRSEWIRTLAKALSLGSNNASPIKRCVERVIVDQSTPGDVIERLKKALRPHGDGGTVKTNNGKALKDNIKFELLKHVPHSERNALYDMCDQGDDDGRARCAVRVRHRKPPLRVDTTNKDRKTLLEDVRNMPSNNAGPIKKLITAAIEKTGPDITAKEALQHLLASAKYDNNSCGSLKSGVAALLRTCANGSHEPSSNIVAATAACRKQPQDCSESAHSFNKEGDVVSSFYRAVLPLNAAASAPWDPRSAEEDMCYVTAGYGKMRYAYAMRCDMQTMEQIFRHVWSLDRSPLSNTKLQITGLPHLIEN
ncbi:hypothetical protein CYMTET_54266 [Cymbomonas tetramitiformis]|uniref:Uncharacterized protein n=1 Tax=Cymbomonas tetramitiformis TaxID=36881 RepID=A0AAE0BGH5_9CHLO|nr:hypothetical protein CYMTET_54266 [Cymbomonas tetramitiformis]